MKSYCSAATAALVLIACSGSSKSDIPTTESSPTTPAPTADAPKKDPPPAAPPPPADPGPTTPKKTGECASTTDKTSCSQCCAKAHQDGASVYIGAVMDCMCQTGTCATACADTLCDPQNPRDPDGPCNACIQQNTGACANDIKNTCTADADCTAFDACIADSGCLSK